MKKIKKAIGLALSLGLSHIFSMLFFPTKTGAAKGLSMATRLSRWVGFLRFRPSWQKSVLEFFGDFCLTRGFINEGLTLWGKAFELLPEPDFKKLLECQKKDWWTGKRYWDGRPESNYSKAYSSCVRLLHEGKWDAMVGLMRLAIEENRKFAQKHQLEVLGIRFLREWTIAIGHIALLDFYIKMMIFKKDSGFRPIILDSKPANRAYLKYWEPYIPGIITNPKGVELLRPLAERLEESIHLVFMKGKGLIHHAAAKAEIQELWENEKRGPLLSLCEKDREDGWATLGKFGIPRDAWFVSLHVRDVGGNNLRDVDIEKYFQAMETITSRGGWVIRMGDGKMKTLPEKYHLVDYAHSDLKSEEMDVFLWAQCKFFIGTNSGPAFVPPTFGVPCVLTNWFPILSPLIFSADIGIYKLYYSTKNSQPISFRESFQSGLEMSESSSLCQKLGMEIKDNSSQEINDVVLEMLDRLDGKIQYSDEDEMLQKKFKSIQPNFKEKLGKTRARIGRSFLKKYASLLPKS